MCDNRLAGRAVALFRAGGNDAAAAGIKSQFHHRGTETQRKKERKKQTKKETNKERNKQRKKQTKKESNKETNRKVLLLSA
jgi:hypothetical protein